MIGDHSGKLKGRLALADHPGAAELDVNPLKTYDYLTLARQRVFEWIRGLPAADYTREILAGQRPIAQIMTHIMISEGYYVLRMQGLSVPPYEEWPIKDESPPPFPVLEASWTEQAARTRQALSAVREWGTDLEYEVTVDDGRPAIITASPGDIFTQLFQHEVHHRAQAMVLLRSLGVSVGDVDFNTLMYKRRDVAPS